MRHKQSLLLICLMILIAGCSKEGLNNNKCEQLKAGLAAENKVLVQKALSGLLTTYNKENLSKLTVKLAQDCNISAAEFCYDCIETEPAQTEIAFSFNYQGATVKCNVDFTKGPGNKMEVVGVHR